MDVTGTADEQAGVILRSDQDESDQTYCPSCGYDARGLSRPVCPECGEALDEESLLRSRIPWDVTDGSPGVAAFIKTVWAVLWRPKKLAWAVARPVSLRRAIWFRRLLTLTAWTGLCGMAVFPISEVLRKFNYPLWPWLMVCAVGLLFGVHMISGVHSYLFHPKGLSVVRQNRAVAMSYYACAPLVLSGLGLVPLGVLWALALFLGDAVLASRPWLEGVAFVAMLIWAFLVLVGFVTSYRAAMRWAWLVAERNYLFRGVVAVLLPGVWLLLLVIPGVGLPALMMYLGRLIGVM